MQAERRDSTGVYQIATFDFLEHANGRSRYWRSRLGLFQTKDDTDEWQSFRSAESELVEKSRQVSDFPGKKVGV
jgi:hypothetical protein